MGQRNMQAKGYCGRGREITDPTYKSGSQSPMFDCLPYQQAEVSYGSDAASSNVKEAGFLAT